MKLLNDCDMITWDTEKKICKVIATIILIISAIFLLVALADGISTFLVALLIVLPFDLLFYFIYLKD